MRSLDKAVVRLLESRRIGSLGTINPDGSVHLTAIWYLFQDDRVLIPTSSSSRKAKNVQANGEASVMIDVRSNAAMRGVVVRGRASLVRGVEARTLNRLIHQRYLTGKALTDERIGSLFEENDNVTVAVRCESITTWDMSVEPLRVMFGTDQYLRPLAD